MCVPSQSINQLNASPHANGAVFTSLKDRLFNRGGQGLVTAGVIGPSPSYRRTSGGTVSGGSTGGGGSPVTTTGG